MEIRKTISADREELISLMKEYYDFYNKRLMSSIKSSRNKIIIDAKTKLDLVIPYKVKEIRMDGKKIALTHTGKFFTVSVEKGKHTIKTK